MCRAVVLARAVVLSLIAGTGRPMVGPWALRAFSATSAAIFVALAVKVFLDELAVA